MDKPTAVVKPYTIRDVVKDKIDRLYYIYCKSQEAVLILEELREIKRKHGVDVFNNDKTTNSTNQ